MKKTNNYRYEDRCNKYEWERVWKYHSEADNLYHRRFSFFLVAESMLIVSFASLFRIKSAEHIKFAIIILGLIYTFGWYYLTVRLDKKMEFLKQYLIEKEDRFYYGYMNCVNDHFGRRDIINNDLFIYATLTFWLFLFLLWLMPLYHFLWTPLLAIGIGLILGSLIHILLEDRYEQIPHSSEEITAKFNEIMEFIKSR